MIKAVIFDFGRTLYDRDNDRFFPEVFGILESFSPRYKMAIVSMAPGGDIEERRQVLKDSNTEKYFDSIIFVREDKDSAYEKALVELNVEPKDIAIIDDRVKRGVSWGNRRGSVTIWFRNGKFKDELPDETTGEPTYTITDLSELLKIFENEIEE